MYKLFNTSGYMPRSGIAQLYGSIILSLTFCETLCPFFMDILLSLLWQEIVGVYQPSQTWWPHSARSESNARHKAEEPGGSPEGNEVAEEMLATKRNSLGRSGEGIGCWEDLGPLEKIGLRREEFIEKGTQLHRIKKHVDLTTHGWSSQVTSERGV